MKQQIHPRCTHEYAHTALLFVCSMKPNVENYVINNFIKRYQKVVVT